MTRFLAILAALTCAASAQTYRTVTADTNNVIRTNFTIGSAQVSGAFAISNVTGLQTALDGKLATNGDAIALTNFPSELLRTNGDGSGLTNLPNANLTNATGVLGLANGGTGQTNAALAIEALLPAYTNNEGKILGLDTNLALVWTTNAGGGGGLPETPLAISNGGTGGTNQQSALVSLGIYKGTSAAINIGSGSDAGSAGSQNVAIGTDAIAQFTNSQARNVAIGAFARTTNAGSIAIGGIARALNTNAIQLGTGTNNDANTIQFRAGGSVDTNEWAALANAGTVGTNLLRSADITNAQSAIFTNSTTNAPTNTNAPTPDAWLDIRVGTNDYKVPLWQ